MNRGWARRQRRGEVGLSLIELMIAVAILGIGLLSVLQAIPVIYKAAARAQSLTVCSMLAGEVMAKLKADATWPPVTYPAVATSYESFDAPFEHYAWRRDIMTPGAVVGGSLSAATYKIIRTAKITVRYPVLGSYDYLEFYTAVANYSNPY